MPGTLRQRAREALEKFEHGTLHSGSESGPVVKDKKQAKAIQLNELRRSGVKIPPPPGRSRGRV